MVAFKGFLDHTFPQIGFVALQSFVHRRVVYKALFGTNWLVRPNEMVCPRSTTKQHNSIGDVPHFFEEMADLHV